MKKKLDLPVPKCVLCDKKLTPLIEIEKDKVYGTIPQFLVLYGDCVDCDFRTVADKIDIEKVPYGAREDFEPCPEDAKRIDVPKNWWTGEEAEK